ncbi:MAG TPA: glycosyltransferase family 1 protein [Acidiphilium sp.]|nr:glycosyltransferase family 1 protein [Acidiphilium sp.]
MTPAPLINGRFVTQSLSGVQRFAIEITRALLVRNAGASLLTPQGGSLAWPGAREIGKRQGQVWEQLELPLHARGRLLINLGNTGPLLADRQIVVIHDAGVFSTPEAYSRQFRLWYKFVQKALIRRRATIVTVSAFSRREISRYLSLPESLIRVMPEGTDHMRLMSSDAGILAANGLAPGKFVLGVGTLSAHKNLAALENLAGQLHARGTPLVIAGGMGGAAFNAANESRLPQPARYIGRVSDAALKALYETAGCFVFPSRYEGFGLPPVEALACGCPVACADIPALRESCADAALYFDPNDPQQIAESVLSILDTPSRQNGLRTAGAARAAELTWAGAASILESIAMEVLERR